MASSISNHEQKALEDVLLASKTLVGRLESKPHQASSSRKLVFWGAGRRIEEILETWKSADFKLRAPDYIVDSVSPIDIETLGSIPAMKFEDLKAEDPNSTTIVITAGLLDLQAQIVHNELYYFEILHIRSIEAALFVSKHPKELEAALSLLESAASKRTYLTALGNVISGKFLDASIYEPSPYINNSFVAAPEEGTILFAGAFNGKHLDRFRKASSEAEILAFEPNPMWFETIVEKFSGDSKVLILNSLLGESTETVHYDPDFENHGLAARIEKRSSDRTIALQVSTLDEVYFETPGRKPVSLIALDIEGAETFAIRGARKVIERDRPLLAICLYHSASDFVRIPQLIEDLFPNTYRFEVLQHSPISAIETVLYCIPRNT